MELKKNTGLNKNLWLETYKSFLRDELTCDVESSIVYSRLQDILKVISISDLQANIVRFDEFLLKHMTIIDFSVASGIDVGKVVLLLKTGFYKGVMVDDVHYVERNCLFEDMEHSSNTLVSDQIDNQFIDVSWLCKQLNIPYEHIVAMIRRGSFAGIYQDGHWYIAFTEVECLAIEYNKVEYNPVLAFIRKVKKKIFNFSARSVAFTIGVRSSNFGNSSTQ